MYCNNNDNCSCRWEVNSFVKMSIMFLNVPWKNWSSSNKFKVFVLVTSSAYQRVVTYRCGIKLSQIFLRHGNYHLPAVVTYRDEFTFISTLGASPRKSIGRVIKSFQYWHFTTLHEPFGNCSANWCWFNICLTRGGGFSEDCRLKIIQRSQYWELLTARYKYVVCTLQ